MMIITLTDIALINRKVLFRSGDLPLLRIITALAWCLVDSSDQTLKTLEEQPE